MIALAEISELIDRHSGGDGMHDCALPRVKLIRSSVPTEPIHTVYEPSLCLVAQGRKQAMLGQTRYVYDAAQFLIVSVDLPVIGSVVEASQDRPYLCIALGLNLPVLTELMLEIGDPAVGQAAVGEGAFPGLALTQVDPPMLDGFVRLLRLLDTPSDAAVLAPLAEREILYRLMRGPQRAMLRHIATAESRLTQISRAIAWLKHHYAKRVAIDRLAAVAGMSASSFHHHFKAITTMSPLQYRTQLRLQQARRLMVSEAMDAASAGFQVGYESPSQFSRDYGRLFGLPPMRDAARLRANPELGMVA